MSKQRATELTSLERLKALSKLPSLASQVAEASALCNHASRADMVLKWLLETLKTSDEARSSVGAWQLLGTTLRCLPPARSALLLSPHDLFAIIAGCISNSQGTEHGRELQLAIAEDLSLLLQLASGEDGAPLQAHLSVSAERAAFFVAAWTNAILQNTLNMQDPARYTKQYSLLTPAIRIWHLRKPGQDEHEAFAKNCLVPLGCIISSSSGSQTIAGQVKRKRGMEDQTHVDLRMLESLLAKHVFLPARSAFFESRVAPNPSKRNTVASITVGLSERLSALRTDATCVESAVASSVPNIRPVLLDIALRCSSGLTPRQRLAEVPWTELLFTTLRESQGGSLAAKQGIVKDMLSVIHERHSPVSTGFLSIIFDEHTKTQDDDTRLDALRWGIIREIVKLDPGVFVDQKVAGRLFKLVSGADLAIAREQQISLDVPQDDMLWASLRDDTITPVMQAFAQNRNLAGFVDLWQQQLIRMSTEQPTSVWFELDRAFGSLVETAFTEATVKELIGQHHQIIMTAAKDAKKSKDSGVQAPGALASVTILDSILAGVRSPDLLDALWDDLDAMRVDLLGRPGDKSHSGKHFAAWMRNHPSAQTWALLTTLYDLWYPLYAVKQSTAATTDPTSNQLWPAQLVEQAATLVIGQRREQNPSRAVRKSLLNAEGFLTTIFKYHQEAFEQIRDVLKHIPVTGTHHLLGVPAILECLEECSQLDDVLLVWLEEACAAEQDRMQLVEAFDGICAIISLAAASSRTVVLERCVKLSLTFLHADSAKIKHDVENDIQRATRVEFGLRVLAQFQPVTLSVRQREQILDEMTTLPDFRQRSLAIFEKRLAVMARMLEERCYGAKIFQDSSRLWRLANPSHDERGLNLTDISGQGKSGKSIELLEQVARRVLKLLCSVQHQPTAKSVILKLVDECEQYATVLEAYAMAGQPLRLDLLGLVKVILSEADRNLSPDLAEQCLQPGVLSQFAEYLLGVLETLLAPPDFGVHGEALNCLLDAFIHIPSRAIDQEDAANDLGIFPDSFMQGANAHLLTSAHMAGESHRPFVAWHARCLRALCKYNFTDIEEAAGFLERATIFLKAVLEPCDYAKVLAAVHDALRSMKSSTRLHVMRTLLSEKCSHHKLRVLRGAISSLQREDFEHESVSDDGPPQAFFSQLLQMARDGPDLATTRAAYDCVIAVLKEKPFMTNQFTIETTLSTMDLTARSSPYMSVVYLDVCRTMTVLLQQYRSRLKDRLNVVVHLLQSLLTCLWRKDSQSGANTKSLGERHAKVLARILQLLCNPPPTRGRSHGSDLVDEARKAQAHIGQYIQYVLHHYCAQVLTGTLAEGVREALVPGLWAMIEAMEVNDADSVKILSASMNNSERAVLRGVYEEYTTLGKWRGG